MAKFRTRQAPSPTGYIHLGTARTVLFTDLLARHYKGSWYLRLEDTDRTRLVADAAVKILESLDTVSLTPEEGITLDEAGNKDAFYGVYQQGKYGPYIQSERLKIYHDHAQKLIDKKLAYWSVVSESQKQDLLAVKQASKKPINYYHLAETSTTEEVMFMSLESGLSHPEKPALRYHIQKDAKIVCKDILLGETTFDLALEEDFVILKNDGYPTYHFAHLIDDHLMETTHVIRSQEWYPSIAKHVAMFETYWGEVPQYLHLPFILGETGTKKMSKRDMIVDLAYYIKQGYLPEAIINYLAFLGWNPGTEQELYLTQDEIMEVSAKDRLERLKENLSEEFVFEKLSKSPARFSNEKLGWFNREYIKMLPLPEYVTRSLAMQESPEDAKELADWEYTGYILDQNRAQTLAEIGKESGCVTQYSKPEDSDVAWKKLTPQESKICLKDLWEQVLRPLYQSESAQSVLEDQTKLWSLARRVIAPGEVQEIFGRLTKVFELVIKDWITTYEKDTGSHLWPLRVALSGKTQSPSPFELLAILPMEEVERRITGILV